MKLAGRSGRHRPSVAGGRGRRFLVTVTGLFLVAGAAWLAVNSALFSLRWIRVSGNERMSVAEVERVAGVEMGQNLLRLATGSLRAHLESDPRIARATVRRNLPSTLSIEIKERVPVAAVRVSNRGDRWATLATDGTVLQVGSARPALPWLRGAVRSVAPGEVLSGLRLPLGVLAILPPSLDVVDARLLSGGVAFSVRGGFAVRYGDLQAWRSKNGVMTSLLRWAAVHGVGSGTIDVRLPEAPVLERGAPLT